MEINFTKDEVKKLLQEYYKKLENRVVKVSISSKKELVGLFEEEGCVTSFVVSETMEVMGISKEVKVSLKEDEVKTMLKALFELYGFQLTSLTLNNGLSSRSEGYGMMEHTVKSAYFKGITVYVNKAKNMSLKMIRSES